MKTVSRWGQLVRFYWGIWRLRRRVRAEWRTAESDEAYEEWASEQW